MFNPNQSKRYPEDFKLEHREGLTVAQTFTLITGLAVLPIHHTPLIPMHTQNKANNCSVFKTVPVSAPLLNTRIRNWKNFSFYTLKWNYRGHRGLKWGIHFSILHLWNHLHSLLHTKAAQLPEGTLFLHFLKQNLPHLMLLTCNEIYSNQASSLWKDFAIMHTLDVRRLNNCPAWWKNDFSTTWMQGM